jgi:hypothetical protein
MITSFYPPKDMLGRVEAWQLAANKTKQPDKKGVAAAGLPDLAQDLRVSVRHRGSASLQNSK